MTRSLSVLMIAKLQKNYIEFSTHPSLFPQLPYVVSCSQLLALLLPTTGPAGLVPLKSSPSGGLKTSTKDRYSRKSGRCFAENIEEDSAVMSTSET